MAVKLGVHARQSAFRLLQSVRRTGLYKQVREIAAVNDGTGITTRNVQETALDRLLAAARTAPHYAGIKAEGLEDFPILSKSSLKSDPEAFRTSGYSTEELIPVSTSGSYGVPLTLLLTRQKKMRQQAEVIYFGSWAGYQVGTPHLYVRAASPKSRLKLWAQNEWFASTNHPTDAWAREQVHLIQRKRIQAIIGYPSTIEFLAKTSLEMGFTPADYSFRSAIAIGEALRDEQRKSIESAFGGLCLSRYTAEEVGVMAAECPEERNHHINEASYIVELLDLNDDKPAAPGELGRIVVTDLFSYAMPLVRYDIGDLGVLSQDCPCGRPTAVLDRIEGRTIETITDARNEPLNPYFINPIMNTVPGVKQYQFSQVGETAYELRLIGRAVGGLDRIGSELLRILGEQADVKILNVDEIPALPSGKRPYVINEWQRRQV